MKVAHTADLHIDGRQNDTRETLDEQVERLVWIGRHAETNGADVMLCAGDVFERASTPDERNAAMSVFMAWARMYPVVVVYGNHDRPGDLEYLSYLRTDFPIQVVSRALIANPVDGISVACIPWPRKAWLAGKLAPDVDVGEEAIRALGSILTGFEASFAKLPGHHVLLAHAEIGAAKLDSGQPVAGHADVELSLDDMLRTGAEYIALGHIHKRQTIRDKVCYAGSPRQTTFGQDTDKGYVLFDLSNGELQYIDAPGRRLHTAELSWDGGELRGDTVDLESGQTLVGQSVRIRYTVDSSEAAMAMAEAEKLREKMLAQGAHAVKLEPTVNTTHRVRSEEIQYASTNADRIRAWWSSRNETPARSEHIIAKLGELEVPV